MKVLIQKMQQSFLRTGCKGIYSTHSRLRTGQKHILRWMRKNAAAILEEMTGDTDLVSDILLCMTSKQRAAILAEMDPVYAAKLTVIMYPAKG